VKKQEKGSFWKRRIQEKAVGKTRVAHVSTEEGGSSKTDAASSAKRKLTAAENLRKKTRD